MRNGFLKNIVKATLPKVARNWIREQRKKWFNSWPPVGLVRFGSLRRLQPISRSFGFDRGFCIDRYYIEQFLSKHASDIQGHVLEIGDALYTRKFGGEHVGKSDVLHAEEGNPRATIVADLTSAEHIPSDTFDCIVFTQTLHVIYNTKAVLGTLRRILRPGGVLLSTFPGISQISRYDMDRWGDYGRFTSLSAKKLFREFFLSENITVETYGNVLTAISFIHGLAVEDLRARGLDYCDPDYELLIAARAIKYTG